MHRQSCCATRWAEHTSRRLPWKSCKLSMIAGPERADLRTRRARRSVVGLGSEPAVRGPGSPWCTYRGPRCGAAGADARSRPAGDVGAHRRGPATTQMRPPRRNPKGAWVSRASASLLVVDDAQDIAFLLAPSALIAIPMRFRPREEWIEAKTPTGMTPSTEGESSSTMIRLLLAVQETVHR